MQKSKYQKINNLLVVLAGLFLVLFIGLRILYPKDHFDSTKNNMTVVAAKFETEQKQRGYLAVAPQIEHNFYSAKIEIVSEKDLKFDDEAIAFKGFMAQLYPLGEEIVTAEELREFIFSNDEEIPNGTLISTKGAVYIYSRGKWRPFLGAQIFENLKFDWSRVTALKHDAVGGFQEGERIIFRTPHPDGTIFKTKDDNFFLSWEEKLLPIKSEEIIKSVWEDYYSVTIEQRSPMKIGECKKSSISNNLKCFFPKEYRTREISGNMFIFSLGEELDKITKSKVTLGTFNVFDLENPKITLSVNKKRMIEKYSQEILK
ncbi:hypothetical protein HN784_00810 [bacterium]|nr:hypothetical protein [bacterium]MBT4251616.1 hypothetical protein [bacterium]MBT4597665.1 hypothetical protein [bacterium]MBT6753678.1 hypothetical protein [bacterium]MBT7037815.1 hypothetical protein [bacterium]